MSLAREAGFLLAWDRANWLYLLNQRGVIQAQRQFHPALTSACCADDGSACAAAGGQGEVWWLAPDLSTRWEKRVNAPTLAAATDPFGQYLAVADAQSYLHLFDCTGRQVARTQSPLPLRHLTFVPTAGVVLGAADHGLLIAFDLAGNIQWRVGLVVYIGSLAVSGKGDIILLACFSEGLHLYGPHGEDDGRITPAQPCQLATLSFDGRLLLTATVNNQLLALEGRGRQLASYRLDRPAASLALGALGHDAVVAVADGPVLRLGIEQRPV